MRELDKAVKHINNAIFWIDVRVERLENQIDAISREAYRASRPLTRLETGKKLSVHVQKSVKCARRKTSLCSPLKSFTNTFDNLSY